MKFTHRLVIFLLFVACGNRVFSQLSDKDESYFMKYQDSLQVLARQLFPQQGHPPTDSVKAILNNKFCDLWEVALLNQLSFEFNFDSLSRDAEILKSPDEKFRIINWNVETKEGTHKYYGFIQVKNKKSGRLDLYPLNDVSETVKSPETYNGDHSKWFGMLYYKIIPCEGYYTLLGWDGNDRLSTKKIVDVLSFKPDGSPYFGKNVFNNIPKKFPKRLILEFSGECTISVKYHDDKNMIVYNHVAPPDPYLEGMYPYYVPDGSFDGLEYKRGAWTYVADVNIKNPKSRNDNVKKPKTPEKPIYTPH
jgi:hypothetical protein